MKVEVKIDGLSKVERKFDRIRKVLPRRVSETSKEFSEILLRNIQANLSGVEGMPQPRTGETRASWMVVQTEDGVYTVMTNAAWEPRLEYGFYGIDSLGRYYSQPALPHVQPALAETRKSVRPKFMSMLREVFK